MVFLRVSRTTDCLGKKTEKKKFDRTSQIKHNYIKQLIFYCIVQYWISSQAYNNCSETIENQFFQEARSFFCQITTQNYLPSSEQSANQSLMSHYDEETSFISWAVNAMMMAHIVWEKYKNKQVSANINSAILLIKLLFSLIISKSENV